MRFIEKNDFDSATQGESSDASVRGPVGWLTRVVGKFSTSSWRSQRLVKKQMSILETLALGSKKNLLLVKCGDECFLVGTGSESVQTIVRLTYEAGCFNSKKEGISNDALL